MPIDIFIPHWNRAERCGATIDALLAQDLPVRITILDNASRPSELERLAAIVGTRATLKPLAQNLGFGPAANVGLRTWLATTGGPFAVVAAHDAATRPDCLKALVHAMEQHPHAGIVSAVSGFPHAARLSGHRGPWLPAHPVGEGFEVQDFPHGTLLMVRRACIRDVGVFDERFFAYGCEMELGLRARRAGWSVGVSWDAVVGNPERSIPSAVASYLQVRNAIVIVREWNGVGWAVIRSLASCLNTVRLTFVSSRRPSAFSATARLRAVRDAWTRRMGPPPSVIQ